MLRAHHIAQALENPMNAPFPGFVWRCLRVGTFRHPPIPPPWSVTLTPHQQPSFPQVRLDITSVG
jgi:hypothetical protein